MHHAFSIIAGDMLSSPLLINPSGLLGQSTSKYPWSLFQILLGQGTRITRHMPSPSASTVPVTSRLTCKEAKAGGRECLGFSRHRSSSTRSFHTGAYCYKLDLLCCPELQPFVLCRIWFVVPRHVEACHSSCMHAKQISVARCPILSEGVVFAMVHK